MVRLSVEGTEVVGRTAQVAVGALARAGVDVSIMVSHVRIQNGAWRGSPSPRGGTTIARVSVGGRRGEGVARCSDQDNFSKRIGREIAVGRALKDAGLVVRHPPM